MNADLIQQNWLAIIFSDTLQKLARELFDSWAIIRECLKYISIRARLNRAMLLTFLERIVPDLAPLSVEFLVS
jgi:hypothetical protein